MFATCLSLKLNFTGHRGAWALCSRSVCNPPKKQFHFNYICKSGLKRFPTLSLHCSRSFNRSSFKPLSLFSSSIPSLQLLLRLTLHVLPARVHVIMCFGSRSYVILWTWSSHFSCFVFISSTRLCPIH